MHINHATQHITVCLDHLSKDYGHKRQGVICTFRTFTLIPENRL